MVSDSQHKALQNQILNLFDNIQQFKMELASIKNPKADHNLIGSAADQLSAISEETRDATGEIMDATEAIGAVNDRLKSEIKFGGARPHFDEITKNLNRILEACAFHDVTGQRLSKVVQTINAIEGALNSLVVIVGEDAIAALPASADLLASDSTDPVADGPQLKGAGMTQGDIDEIFD